MRRETVRLRRDHLEERSTPSGLIVTRHAIERFHERERCRHDEVRRRLLADMAEAERCLALAIAADLFSFGGRFDPDAHAIIPFGGGALLMRNVVVAMRRGSRPTTRYTVERRGVVANPVTADPKRLHALDDVGGLKLDGYVLTLGMTYVSEEMLHLEQHAYLAMFRREMQLHDLDALGDSLGNVWLPHETAKTHPSVDVHPRLRFLLSQISMRQPPGRMALSIGWERTADPREDESPHQRG